MRLDVSADPHAGIDWIDAYRRARQRECWAMPDEAVATLPHVARSHPHHAEWLARGDSAARLLAYMRRLSRPLRVVELGCGNGWLANRVATIDNVRVVGIDVDTVELDRARRVFGQGDNLQFVEHDILAGDVPIGDADIVVLASVIQYVPEPGTLIARLLRSVPPGGEVHVIDSPVYRPSDVSGARARTQQHYASIGVPEMAGAYHHHDWTAFEPLTPHTLYNAEAALHRIERRWLRRPRSPFPWLRFVASEMR